MTQIYGKRTLFRLFDWLRFSKSHQQSPIFTLKKDTIETGKNVSLVPQLQTTWNPMILCEQQHSLFHPMVLCGNEKFYVFLRGKWERYQHGSIKSTTRIELSSGKNYYICIHRSFILCQFWSRIFSHGSIYDLAFKPDGSQLIVAAGNRVLVIYVFWFEINLDSEYFRDVCGNSS